MKLAWHLRLDRGSNFSLTFIQCASCGGVVGVMDYYNIGQLLHDLANKLGKPLT